jgi:DNA polymerase type B, organellar and viral
MTRRRIAVIDCETDPFKRYRIPKPFAWGYYDGEQYHQFTDTARAAAFLAEQDVICYAHNGGRFDWHFLLDYATPFDPLMLINGRIASMRIGLAECRDSYNILPIPLREYKKDDMDYSIMEEAERHKPKNWARIMAYLRNDCVYLHELITRFIGEYGQVLTQAGAAMKQWQKISEREVPRTTGAFHEQFAPYYYGGRVQCFQSGIIETDFSVYDINSAYPYAMLHKHPYSDTYSQIEGYERGADFYRVRCKSLGAFPFRGLGGGESGSMAGLSFPQDGEVREFTVTGWEYDAARATKTLAGAKILESITFTDHTDFAPYVNHFYQARLGAKARGDTAGGIFAKLFMVSLYGKFAANPENYREYMVVPMNLAAGLGDLVEHDGEMDNLEGWEFGGEFGPWALAERKLDEHRQRFYNVATGASITGFVRAMLWRAICSSKGVIYCDTDSIAVRAKGASILLNDGLGHWKHEGDFDRAGIAGKKLYIMRGVPDAKGVRAYKVASKGVRLTNAQLWQVARGGCADYIPDVPTFSPKKTPVFTKRHIINTAVTKRGIINTIVDLSHKRT